jgi:hypothetical protein
MPDLRQPRRARGSTVSAGEAVSLTGAVASDGQYQSRFHGMSPNG